MRKSRRAKRSRRYRKRKGRIGKVRLDMMENPFGPPPSALRALREIDTERVSAYPEDDALRLALSAHLSVAEESIILGNGSDELIQNIFDAFCEEGDAALIPQPTFSIFDIAAERAGAELLRIDYNDDLSFPKEGFVDALKRNPRIAVIVTPNNPTGTTVDRNFILDTASRFPDTLFLIDEAYAEFCGETVIDEAPKTNNLVILRTFSKAFGLAGLRCGYAVASEKIVQVVESLRAPYVVNAVAIRAAAAALSDKEWLKQTVERIVTERRRLKGALLLRGIKTVESEANFVLANFGDEAKTVTETLEAKGILVKNISELHRLMEGMVRISVGTPEQNARLIRTLDETLPDSALIFDVDGTLVDVSGSYHLTIKECVKRLSGEEPSLGEIYELKNSSGYNDDIDIVSELCRRRGKNFSYEEIEPLFNEVYEGEPAGTGAVSNERLLVDKELLEKLSSRFRLAIFTGRSGKHLKMVTERFGIDDYFETAFVLDETPEDKRKPHPFGLLRVMERLGCARGCYIGDIPDDVRSAKAAGLIAVSVLPPVREPERYREALINAGSDFVLEEINELRRLLYE